MYVCMRTNITISIDVGVLGRFDELRGKVSRGDYIGSLIGSEAPVVEIEVPEAPQKPLKPRKAPDKTTRKADSGKKGLGSQEMEGGFVTYFKDTKF